MSFPIYQSHLHQLSKFFALIIKVLNYEPCSTVKFFDKIKSEVYGIPCYSHEELVFCYSPNRILIKHRSLPGYDKRLFELDVRTNELYMNISSIFYILDEEGYCCLESDIFDVNEELSEIVDEIVNKCSMTEELPFRIYEELLSITEIFTKIFTLMKSREILHSDIRFTCIRKDNKDYCIKTEGFGQRFHYFIGPEDFFKRKRITEYERIRIDARRDYFKIVILNKNELEILNQLLEKVLRLE